MEQDDRERRGFDPGAFLDRSVDGGTLAEQLTAADLPPILQQLGTSAEEPAEPLGEPEPDSVWVALATHEPARQDPLERLAGCLAAPWQWLLRTLLLQDAGPVPGGAAGQFVYSQYDRAAAPVHVAVLPQDAVYLCMKSGRRTEQAAETADQQAAANRGASGDQAADQAGRAAREERARARQERDTAGGDPVDDTGPAGNPLDKLDELDEGLARPLSAHQAQRHRDDHGRGGVTWLLDVQIGTVWRKSTVTIDGQDRPCCYLASVDVRTTWLALINAQRRLYVRDWSGAGDAMADLARVDLGDPSFTGLPADRQNEIRDGIRRLTDRGDESSERTRRATPASIVAHERGHIVFFLETVRRYFARTRIRRAVDTEAAVAQADREIRQHLRNLVWAMWDAMTRNDKADYPAGDSERFAMLAHHSFLNDHAPGPTETDNALARRHHEAMETVIEADRRALATARAGARALSNSLTPHCRPLDAALDSPTHPAERSRDRCFPPD